MQTSIDKFLRALAAARAGDRNARKALLFAERYGRKAR